MKWKNKFAETTQNVIANDNKRHAWHEMHRSSGRATYWYARSARANKNA